MTVKASNVFNPNQISAELIVNYARSLLFENNQLQEGEIKDKSSMKFLLIYDLYIKARSYAFLNKVAFFLSLIFGILVLLWPSIAIVSQDFGWEKEFLKSAVVQTTITGIAILTFAIYSHYKKRQLHTENLMRYALYSEDTLADIKEKVILEMARIDTGFSFSQAVFKKSSEAEDEKSKK